MIRVVFVALFAEATRGGQVNLLRLLEGLDRERFAPLLVSPAPGSLAEAARGLGLPVEEANMAGGEAGLHLRRLAIQHRADIIYVDGVAHVIPAAFAAAAGARVVWHAQVAQPNAADRVACELADVIVCCSHAVEARVARYVDPSRLRRIVNAVDCTRFRASEGTRGTEPTLLYAGAIEHDKGLLELLAAFALVRASEPRARLRIAGSGPLDQLACLRQEAVRLGLADAVDWLGYRRDIETVFRASDVFVLLSPSEGMSLALLEAAASECGIVMSDIEGNRDALPNDAATTVPVSDPVATANAILHLMTSPDERLARGRRAREAMLRSHRIDQFVEGFAKTFEGITRNASS